MSPSSGPWDETLPDGTPAMEVGLRRPELLQRGGDSVVPATRPRIVGHPPLGPQPPRPLGIPLDAHWDEGPGGGEWISPSGGRAVSRLRSTAPEVIAADPDATRQRAVTFDPQTGKPNETFYRERNDAGGLYDAYRNWEPHGAKRGLKNSLKSALLMGAEAVKANPNDPVTAGLIGLGVGAGAGTAAPNFLNRLRRQQRLPQLAAEVGSELDRSKTQAAIDASQMVPITLDSGETVMVPAKQAATLRSRQQEIGLRDKTFEARKKRWDSLSSNERRRTIIAEYKSGMLNHDPEALDQAARELNIPGQMLPAFISGQMRDALDDEGNLIQVNRQTGDVTTTGQPSFEGTKETNRNERQRRAIEGANQRAVFNQGQINQRQANRPTAGPRPDTVTGRKAATLIGKIEQRRRTMVRADELLKANPDDADARAMREKAQAEGEGFAAELNALGAGYEAGPGNLGYPYYKRGGNASQQSTGRYAGKHFPAANLPEAAKRLGVSEKQAREYLESEGAVIY